MERQSYMSPEQKGLDAANYILLSIAAGLAAGTATLVAQDKFTGISNDFEQQLDLDDRIWQLQNQNDTLTSAQGILRESGDTETGIQSVVGYNNSQITELESQKDQLGSVAGNTAEVLGLPIVLGMSVFAYCLKGSINKIKANRL